MIRRALRGLRGRLLLAFVATSAVTLAVAAAITLSPLQERLREGSATALQDAAEDMRPEFNTALVKAGENEAKEPKGYAEEDLRLRDERASDLVGPTFDLRERTGGARVLVADLSFTNRLGEAPAFLYDTDVPGRPERRVGARVPGGPGGIVRGAVRRRRAALRDAALRGRRDRRRPGRRAQPDRGHRPP